MPAVGSVFGKPLDDDIYGIQNALAIIVSGDTAPIALSQGKYIYLINHSTIRSGLYRIISAISSGDTIVSTDIEVPTDGIINDLIEANGTKVNKTDIVDNLTTNDPTKVLSAAQGYALNSKFITDNFTATLESNSSVSPYSAYTVKNVAKTNYSIISALCTSHNSSNTVLINSDGTTYLQIYGTRAEQISVTVIYAKN